MALLIVDGYNIINQWQELEDLRRENMEVARLKLSEILQEYTPLIWEKIIIVYDAYRVKGKPQMYETQNIETIFTGENQSADVFIERLVATLFKIGEEIEVASSDNLEQHIVLWKGGRRLSARELRLKILEYRQELSKERGAEVPSRNLLDEMLSDKVRGVLEKWRRL